MSVAKKQKQGLEDRDGNDDDSEHRKTIAAEALLGGVLRAHRRVRVVGAEARSVAFAVAHGAVRADAAAYAVFCTVTAASPVKALAPRGTRCRVAGDAHGDGEELERVWFKFFESHRDLTWFFNNVQCWSAVAKKPTLLVVDGQLFARCQPPELLLLLKLADDAARCLGAAAVVAVPEESPLVCRYFPARVTLQATTLSEYTVLLPDDAESLLLLTDCDTYLALSSSSSSSDDV